MLVSVVLSYIYYNIVLCHFTRRLRMNALDWCVAFIYLILIWMIPFGILYFIVQNIIFLYIDFVYFIIYLTILYKYRD